jgi:hypothetical protein
LELVREEIASLFPSETEEEQDDRQISLTDFMKTDLD